MGVLTGQRNRSFPAFAETEQNSTGELKGGRQTCFVRELVLLLPSMTSSRLL